MGVRLFNQTGCRVARGARYAGAKQRVDNQIRRFRRPDNIGSMDNAAGIQPEHRAPAPLLQATVLYFSCASNVTLMPAACASRCDVTIAAVTP